VLRQPERTHRVHVRQAVVELTARGATGVAEVTISKMHIDNYHVNFVYNWGESDAKLRPYAFVGLGATNYSPSGNVLVGAPGRTLDGNAQFSTTWGAGVKYYVAPSVGVKASMRWTPTYIKSDPAGYWCDPFYGCWLLSIPTTRINSSSRRHSRSGSNRRRPVTCIAGVHDSFMPPAFFFVPV
jgi:hypothetical protein